MNSQNHDPLPIAPLPVGQLLARELQARAWSQADFAAVLDRPVQFVSEIVNGKKEITRESAAQIGAALDVSAEMWLNLQDQFLLTRQAKNQTAQTKLDHVRRRARLNEKGPIQLLLKRGYLEGGTLADIEAQVQELFELESLDDEPAFATAAKRANSNDDISALQRAWVACVRKEARQVPPKQSYSPKKLKKLAAGLSQSLVTADDFRHVPDLLKDVGVRVVYVEALPGAKIDGCAMIIDGYPVIGLSGRGKRLDKVLFTLLHEIAHILLKHVDAKHLIVEDLDDHDRSESDRERAANLQAVDLAFPDGFPSVPKRIDTAWVNRTAKSLGVARIVIVGQLQHRRRLDWRTTLAKGAPAVDEAMRSWD